MGKKKMYSKAVYTYHQAILPLGHFANSPWIGVLDKDIIQSISKDVVEGDDNYDFKNIVKLGKVCYDGALNIIQIYRANFARKHISSSEQDNGLTSIEPPEREKKAKKKGQTPGGKKLKRLKKLADMEDPDYLPPITKNKNNNIVQFGPQSKEKKVPLYQQMMKAKTDEVLNISIEKTKIIAAVNVDSVDKLSKQKRSIGKTKKRTKTEIAADTLKNIQRTLRLAKESTPLEDSGRMPAAGIG
jgi:hypothetical protein